MQNNEIIRDPLEAREDILLPDNFMGVEQDPNVEAVLLLSFEEQCRKNVRESKVRKEEEALLAKVTLESLQQPEEQAVKQALGQSVEEAKKKAQEAAEEAALLEKGLSESREEAKKKAQEAAKEAADLEKAMYESLQKPEAEEEAVSDFEEDKHSEEMINIRKLARLRAEAEQRLREEAEDLEKAMRESLRITQGQPRVNPNQARTPAAQLRADALQQRLREAADQNNAKMLQSKKP